MARLWTDKLATVEFRRNPSEALQLTLTSPLTKTMTDPQRAEIVSDDSELLILVDDEDRELGHLDKAACHDDSGILHRAFSLFIFNSQVNYCCNNVHPTNDYGAVIGLIRAARIHVKTKPWPQQ